MGEANQEFFRRFTPQNSNDSELSNSQLDLSLGLSLGGGYNRIPKEEPLIRSSSLNENDGEFLSLARSSSLPTETGQGQRMTKVLQIMERTEAKRRLLEKQRSAKGGSDEERPPVEAVPPTKGPIWAVESASRNVAFCRAVEKIKTEVKALKNQTIQGLRNSTVDSSPNNFQPVVTSEAMANGESVKPARSRSVPLVSSGTMANGKPVKPAETEQKNPSKKIKVSDSGMREIGVEMIMKQMPSVTTTGDGPNGRRIEGFLYKYMKGHVSIVCVCHGNFLSPAEFVEHAGGSEVANPMKHINVLPPSF
uniref:Ninja-family protein n=1 Tax=Davidia involucrata TaxID=16924 RepID=A0A5B6YHC4_DAVIN